MSVGIDHDTADFATATLLQWWEKMGHERYPEATDLMITADGGGANSSRSHLWKVALQRFADQTNLRLWISHFPPGTSKWNKIEHRMFAFITQNWRGRPLVSHEVIVSLIANTTTDSGLRIQAALDREHYPTGKRVEPEELASVQLRVDPFQSDWNYTITPHSQARLHEAVIL